MKEYAELSKKILDNNMDFVVTWKSKGEGIETEIELVDSMQRRVKIVTGENFEQCMEELGRYFEN